MSHATLTFSFISPAPRAGVKAEAVSSSHFIVSATYSCLLAVFLRVSGFVQNALGNSSDYFQALKSSFVHRKFKRNGEALNCLTKVLKDLTK